MIAEEIASLKYSPAVWCFCDRVNTGSGFCKSLLAGQELLRQPLLETDLGGDQVVDLSDASIPG